MSHLLDQLLDARRAEECRASDEAMNATTARFQRASRGSPAEYAGSVSGPFRRPLAEQIAGTMLAVWLGVAGAMALVRWWLS